MRIAANELKEHIKHHVGLSSAKLAIERVKI